MKVFVNASLSTQAKRRANSLVAGAIRKEGFACYLPQQSLPVDAGLDAIDILRGNQDAVAGCDLVVSILDDPGLGVAFELGFAIALGKPIFVLRTDLQTDLGKILEGFWESIAAPYKSTSLDELLAKLRSFSTQRLPVTAPRG